MKKALLFLLGLVLVAPAFASVRTDGMGILPIQDEDIDLIWVFPQAAADYAVVDYRLEDDDSSYDNWGGIIHTDKYLGNYGLYIGRPFQGAPSTGLDYIDGIVGGSIFNGIGNWKTRLEWGNGHTPYDTLDWNGGPFDSYDVIGNPDRMPENKFDFFKTKKMGGGVLGIRVNLAGERNLGAGSLTTTEYTGEVMQGSAGSRVLNVVLGYGKKDVGPFNAFDLALGYGIASGKDQFSLSDLDGDTFVPVVMESFKLKGTHEMTVNLRGVKEVSDATKLVTNVEFMANNLGMQFDFATDPDMDGTVGEAGDDVYMSDAKMSSTKIALGHNCVHKVHDGVAKVIAGMNLQYNKAKWNHNEYYNALNEQVADQIWAGDNSGEEMTRTFFGLWANVGVEANVLKWLQFRGGFAKALLASSKTKIVTPYDYTGTNNAPQEANTVNFSGNETSGVMTTFGAGVVYKNWNVDMLYSTSQVESLLSNPRIGDGVAYNGSLLGLHAAKLNLRYNL